MATAKAYAAASATAPLAPFQIERRAVGAHDIQIEIAYCGICHSDIHTIREEWGGIHYPMIPGHEIGGIVEEGWPHGGVGANLAALIGEQAFDELDAPVQRVTGADVPMPYSKPLEDIAYPHEAQVVAAALASLGQEAPR